MRTVFVAHSPFEAHLIANLLRDAGVDVMVSGESLQGALGELPLDLSTMPEVKVVRDEDAGRALTILAERKRAVSHPGETHRSGT